MQKSVPKLLRNIKPKVGELYFKGDYNESFFDKCVAVVGSRRITSYGERVLEKIIPPLVQAGVTIVSGYMYGVDKTAHKLTLECGGRTIAVLGWGIDWGNEPVQKNLLFVSEYPGEQKPQLWMFPKRNRIIAGLSQGVVVVEAATESGSLITADFALKYKRKLFTVPGPITSRASEGTNNLIKDGLAFPVTNVSDIIGNLGWKMIRKDMESNNKTGIIGLLLNEPLSVDGIAKKLGKSVEEVGIELSILQLRGEVFEDNGNFFVKIP